MECEYLNDYIFTLIQHQLYANIILLLINHYLIIKNNHLYIHQDYINYFYF